MINKEKANEGVLHLVPEETAQKLVASTSTPLEHLLASTAYCMKKFFPLDLDPMFVVFLFIKAKNMLYETIFSLLDRCLSGLVVPPTNFGLVYSGFKSCTHRSVFQREKKSYAIIRRVRSLFLNFSKEKYAV